MKKGFATNIEKDTLENNNFRKVLYTSKHSQLVLMSLRPGEEIGMEVHSENDQFFRFEKGRGKVIIDGNEYEVADGTAVVIPAGAEHNVINVSNGEETSSLLLPPERSEGRDETLVSSNFVPSEAREEEDLKFYTIYSPAHHKDAIVRLTKEEAEANEEDFDGITSE